MSDVSLASSRRLRSTLNVGEVVRKIGPDLSPEPIIYWSDLLASVTVGWACFALAAGAPELTRHPAADLPEIPHCCMFLGQLVLDIVLLTIPSKSLYPK